MYNVYGIQKYMNYSKCSVDFHAFAESTGNVKTFVVTRIRISCIYGKLEILKMYT